MRDVMLKHKHSHVWNALKHSQRLWRRLWLARVELRSQRTPLPGSTCCLRTLPKSSRYWLMVSVQSTGAYRPSALLVNTAGSSGVFEPRKLCMYSFSRFQQSPGITQAQYSTCGHTNTITAPYHASLMVRSHQTRMKRYARMIYMLSQCKDAIDNPAALFTRMRRRELSAWGDWRASWKIWTLADIRGALTNQELALAVTWLRAEAENPKQQWRTV